MILTATNKSGIAGTVKRELIRAMLERSQSMNVAEMSPSARGGENVYYKDVEEKLNIPYINRDEVPLAMDVFKPKAPEKEELPVIVTIHGGGLTLGDRSISRNFGRLLAHRGYLVFSVEYRLAPRANVCEELDDVCAGLDFVGRSLVDYNVNFQRMFLAAESAGAYLALYVAAMKGSRRLQEAIGHEPSRMRFKALGLNCGMFYTNRNDPCGWMLSEQIYGEKRADEHFLQYMDPEHPEIVEHLPPVFLCTGRGDFLNDYSISLHEALKKAGKTSRLVYYPDEDLGHAYFTTQTYHPSTLEAIDKMLAFFEEQAALKTPRRRRGPAEKAALERIKDGSISEQNLWSYLRERAEADPERAKATAIIDCTREYTYAQLFAECERYGRVFSALGMTGKDGARVGLAGAITAEPLFCFYGLNMCGATVDMLSYPDFLPGGKWKTMLQKDKVTDLIITDVMVTSQLWEEIEQAREALGLRHVILLHSRMGGPCVGPAELAFNEFNYHLLQQRPGAVFMEELLKRYKDAPIAYGAEDGDRLALITHSSGTTKGTRKPLPYTNRAINVTLSGFDHIFKSLRRGTDDVCRLRLAPSFDYSSFLMFNLVNCALASGDAAVLTFFGFLHPKFVRAVGYYKLDVMFTSGFMFDKWLEREDTGDIDFSSLRILSCGGSYTPPEKMKKYTEFAKAHGYRYSIFRGYGMSETGGAQLMVPEGCEDDILGFPVPVEDFLVQDESDGQFYTAKDGVRTGTMYVASDSRCCNELDGETIFTYTVIDGRDFICTNDLVRVNKNGSFSYAGRADRYFVNNEGVRFDPGVVEVEMAAQKGVDRCAVVPVLEKRIHDTVPVLYIVPAEKGKNAPELVRQALIGAFVRGDRLADSNLPSQFVIVDDIPCNSNGKIDIYRITRERLQGKAYNILPVREGERLSDIRIELAEQLSSIKAGTLPEGMAESNPMGLYDLFNAQAPQRCGPFALPGLPFGKKASDKEKKPPQPPEKLMKAAMGFMGMLYGQKTYDSFFER